MRNSTLGGITAVVALLISACTPSNPRTSPVPPPIPTPIPDTGVIASTRRLTLVPGHFQYYVLQNATIRTDAVADTMGGGITTTARLVADVSADSDSSYTVVISIDSVQMTSQGAIPSRGIAQVSFLGPVLRASVRARHSIVEMNLADSLCAYGQFVTAARDLLLPALPSQVIIPLPEARVDTMVTVACRAGSRIQMTVVRELKNFSTDPLELTLQGKTELAGLGMVRDDSVSISGTLTTRGKASFTGEFRLPSLVQTESDGSITVRLGDSVTVFHQRSTQEIRQTRSSASP